MEELLLKSSFEKEAKLFLAEFQKLNYENIAKSKEFVLGILENHLNHLFMTCIKEYTDLCTLNCISGIELYSDSKSSASKSFVAFPTIDGIAEAIVSELVGAVKFFYDQKRESDPKASRICRKLYRFSRENL